MSTAIEVTGEVRRGKDAAKGDRTPYFSVVLEHGEGEESLSLSLAHRNRNLCYSNKISVTSALRIESGLSDNSGRARERCPENGLSLIVIIFLTGSRLDLTRYNDRDFGFWSPFPIETKSGALRTETCVDLCQSGFKFMRPHHSC